MKLLKNIFALALALALITPAFALSGAITEGRDYGKIVLTDSEKQEIYNLLDDTIAKRNEQTEKFYEFHHDTKQRHDKKRLARNLAIAIPISVVVSVASFGTAAGLAALPYTDTSVGSAYPQDFVFNNEQRLERYNETKDLYLSGNASRREMYKAQSKFVKSLTKLFMDDPASALDIVAEKREFFPLMMENDPKVIRMLKTFNTVVSEDLDTYSGFSIKKLAHANTEVYFERLAEYARMQKVKAKEKAAAATKKEIIQTIKDSTADPRVEKVMIRETKKQARFEKQVERMNKAAGVDIPFPHAEPKK